ncbi:MAG: hypothetical protein ACD_79C00288G0008 [uncultured bacterium]|nr:MAG: hypothetical protein ACD_79C00288G0008 [uncultured bacterium]
MNTEHLIINYAKALYNVLTDKDQWHKIKDELTTISSFFTDKKKLKDFVECPKILASDKEKFLENVLVNCSVSNDVKNFCRIMLKNGRLFLIDEVINEFEEIAMEDKGLIKAVVSSSYPIKDEDLNKIKDFLKRQTSREIIIKCEDKPELIAGIIIKMGNMIIDGSLKCYLNELKYKLCKI